MMWLELAQTLEREQPIRVTDVFSFRHPKPWLWLPVSDYYPVLVAHARLMGSVTIDLGDLRYLSEQLAVAQLAGVWVCLCYVPYIGVLDPSPLALDITTETRTLRSRMSEAVQAARDAGVLIRYVGYDLEQFDTTRQDPTQIGVVHDRLYRMAKTIAGESVTVVWREFGTIGFRPSQGDWATTTFAPLTILHDVVSESWSRPTSLSHNWLAWREFVARHPQESRNLVLFLGSGWPEDVHLPQYQPSWNYPRYCAAWSGWRVGQFARIGELHSVWSETSQPLEPDHPYWEHLIAFGRGTNNLPWE